MRAFLRKNKHAIGIVLLFLLMLFLEFNLIVIRAKAADHQAEKKGSITIQLKDLGSDREGTVCALYRVGNLVPGMTIHFEAVEELKGAGLDFDNMQSAKAQEEGAKACVNVLPYIPIKESAAGADGLLKFSNLEQGVYLVYQTEEAKYGRIAPFLVFLPYTNEEGTGLVYDIVTEPKAEHIYVDTAVLKIDEDEKPIAGAKLALYDARGNKLTEWISGTQIHLIENLVRKDETYTIKEEEAPEGYLMAEHKTFIAGRESPITITMVDKKKSTDYRIKITKYVMSENEYRSVDASFYAALFWDRECTQRASAVLELRLQESYCGGLFEDMAPGTYYLAETDEAGTPLDVTSEFAEFTNEISRNEITLDPQSPVAEAVITNHLRYTDGNLLEDDARIIVRKKVVAGGDEKKVSETFYFTLYSDEEKINILETKALVLENESTGSVVFEKKAYGTYYIAESDDNGIPVNEEGFAYEVRIDNEKVVVSGSAKQAAVEIINDAGGITDTNKDTSKINETNETKTKGNSTIGKGAKTGDNSQSAAYVFILAAAGLTVAGGIIIDQRRTRLERGDTYEK